MKCYLVGGAVRDQLLNIPVTDLDYVVVGATQEEMIANGYTQVGKSFPVFLHPKTKCEYALARKEKKSGHGYTGFVCDFSPSITIDEDLCRRDLTINAIAKSECGEYIDPCKGIEDIKNKIIRHIGPAFAEDPLRVLRVARFAAKLFDKGFKVHPQTMEIMKHIVSSGELSYIVPERIFAEFDKVLHEGRLDIFIKVLKECGALKQIFPEIDALYGIPARKYWHPEVDTGIHMELCLSYACKNQYQPIEKFALFCHDFGKAKSDPKLWPSHRKHGEKGVPLIKEFAQRLHIPNDYQEAAIKVASEHSFVHSALNKTNHQILDLLKRIDAFRKPEMLKILLNCCRADLRGRLGFENLPYIHAQLIDDIFLTIKEIDVKEIIKDGYKGKEISEQLDIKRLNVMNEFRNTWIKIHQKEIQEERKEDPNWNKLEKHQL